ncbi:hypothetical protein AAG570_007730, partial [Ranatra chinensis]
LLSQIRDEYYEDAIPILKNQLIKTPQARACLSLLGYCYYNLRDFSTAAEYYQKLAKLYPEIETYTFYYAQCLYRESMYSKALDNVCMVQDKNLVREVTLLKAAIHYAQDDLISTQFLLDRYVPVDRDIEINRACILYKEEKYNEAIAKLKPALATESFNPHLSYNMALCYYSLKDYQQASKYIADIMERGIQDHPELGIGATADGFGLRIVGNTPALLKTAVIEAFNLKAAIEYQLNNLDAAKEALTDMPPRREEDIDPVTLHNQAILNMDEEPALGFEKLEFLLRSSRCPHETLHNILISYCKYEYYNLAADCLAEFIDSMHRYITPYLYNFVDAMITYPVSPQESYRKLDVIGNRHTEGLRKATKRVREARDNHDDEGVKSAISDYEKTLESYIPVLMAQARIFWNLKRYDIVEKIFHGSADYCSENETWRLHVADVLFMQENKYKEASGFYESIVKKYHDNILSVSSIVLANLCVSYIMTAMNEEAEELMRKIEKEEERLRYEEPEKKVYHLSIVNLVIGTLYCAKGNFEFGISRLIRSIEPYRMKLGTETWYHAKRCIISLVEHVAKRFVIPSDAFYRDCIVFLEQCEGEHKVFIIPVIISQNIKAEIVYH